MADALADFGFDWMEKSCDPAWRTQPVVGLAQAAYEEQHLTDGLLDSTRLAVLADALEESGCTNPVMLEHLRDGDPHFRGCWVVELLLAYE
jgi:hypothetical protein